MQPNEQNTPTPPNNSPVPPTSPQPATPPTNPQPLAGGTTSPTPAASSDSQAKTKLLKGKVVKIIIAIVLIMVVGTVAASLLLARSQKYSEKDLTTYSDNLVSFKYPKSWQKVTSLSDAKVAFGEKSEVAKATAVIVYTNTNVGLLPSDKLNAAQSAALQQELKTLATSSEIKSSLEKKGQCKGSGDLTATDLKNNVLTGQKLNFGCKREKGGTVKVIAYIGLAKDNSLHTIEVDGVKSAWSANETIFQSMLDSFTVK